MTTTKSEAAQPIISRRAILLSAASLLAAGAVAGAEKTAHANDNERTPPAPAPASAGRLNFQSWPRDNAGQQELVAYFGNPRGLGGGPSTDWERESLITLAPPYRMAFAGREIRGIRVHRRVATSLARILMQIERAAGGDQATLDAWGASDFGGSYVFRQKRTSPSLSMHAYGIAIDLNPRRNGLGNIRPYLTADHPVVQAFEAEGWVWGGRWRGRSIDAMHFQATKSYR